MTKLIVAIDQGTTGSTVLVLDETLAVLGRANQEFTQHFPQPGWVEHEPKDILASVETALKEALGQAQANVDQIACIGITNQRETVVVWDKETGKPVHRAIVWQDRRTAKFCETLKAEGIEAMVRAKTGLLCDPYFSGTKIKWILDETQTRPRAEQGAVICGTIDTFLVWQLTDGKAHITDPSNACRTLLMNLETLEWDDDLLTTFDVPRAMLPSIVSSSEIYGVTKNVDGLPDGIPISGIAGDQQAALFGQACFTPGEAKCTYGTGCFVLMNTGNDPVRSSHGLLTSVGWSLNGEVTYVLEGSAFIAGAAVQWLRDGLGLIQSAPEIETLAGQVEDSGGVYFVPALTGIGAPHWNPHARGQITGITRGTTSAHLCRATLDGIAFQNYEILDAMEKDSGIELSSLKVDGGAAANNLLMQTQAELIRGAVVRPKFLETTALGAAFLAGLAVGVWPDLEALKANWQKDRLFERTLPETRVADLKSGWQQAISKL